MNGRRRCCLADYDPVPGSRCNPGAVCRLKYNRLGGRTAYTEQARNGQFYAGGIDSGREGVRRRKRDDRACRDGEEGACWYLHVTLDEIGAARARPCLICNSTSGDDRRRVGSAGENCKSKQGQRQQAARSRRVSSWKQVPHVGRHHAADYRPRDRAAQGKTIALRYEGLVGSRGDAWE